MGALNQNAINSPGNSSATQAIILQQDGSYDSTFDWTFFVLMGGLAIVMFIFSWFAYDHPLLLVLWFGLGFFAVYMSITYTNWFQSAVNNSSLVTYSSVYPLSFWVCNNLPVYFAIIVFGSLLILFLHSFVPSTGGNPL